MEGVRGWLQEGLHCLHESSLEKTMFSFSAFYMGVTFQKYNFHVFYADLTYQCSYHNYRSEQTTQ